MMQLRGLDEARVSRLDILGGRQTRRRLEQLRRDLRCAACGGGRGAVVDSGRNGLGRSLGAEREMPRSLLRLVDRGGQPTVHSAPA